MRLFFFPLCCLFSLFYTLFVITVARNQVLFVYSSEVFQLCSERSAILISFCHFAISSLPSTSVLFTFSMAAGSFVSSNDSVSSFLSASDSLNACWASLSFHQNWYPLSLFSFCISFSHATSCFSNTSFFSSLSFTLSAVYGLVFPSWFPANPLLVPCPS